MDIALLKTFLEVVRLRHFGKAADTLCITQSAVSARIKLLESQLGIQLLVRERKEIQLTPAGHRLLRHAETIVSGWERARQEIALAPAFSATLAVGLAQDLWSIQLKQWVVRMRREQPAVALRIETHPGDTLVNRLTSHLLDLAFMFEPPMMQGLETEQVLEVPLEDIPSNRSFFEIGGHSLRATTVISRLHNETGVKIPLGEFFKKQTVEQQARYIESAEKENARKILGIYVVVGEFSGVIKEAVEFYFSFLSKDTIASDASLFFMQVPAQLRCRNCDTIFSPERHDSYCPNCDEKQVEILSGREVYIESMDIE